MVAVDPRKAAAAVAKAAAESAKPTVNLAGLCDHSVGLWWGLAHSGQVDAAAHWKSIPAARKHVGNAADAPAGSLVFFNPDHVALSAGGGKVWSTDIRRPGKVDLVTIGTITSNWSSFIKGVYGWADPVFPGTADFGAFPAPVAPAKPPAPKPAPKPAAVEGVDYSFGRPTPASLVAAGKHFAIRYLSGGGTKDLAAAEAAALHKAGLGIVLVWENGGKAALGGAAQGTLDATKALKQATALGAPKTTPIYLAVDFDATTAQKPTVLAYFAAASKILTPARTGIYAGVNPITWLIAAKTAQWYWLTYAWQGSAAIPAATHLYQYKNDQSIGGAGVDFDRALRPAFGAWLPLPVPVVPKPVVLAPKPVVQPPAPKPIVTPVSVPPVVQPPVQPVHVGPTPPVTVGGPAPIQPAPVVVPPPPVVVNWTSTPATKPSWWAAWVAWVTKWLH